MGFDSLGHWHDEKERTSFPATAKSEFDPIVRMANREQALITCRIFDAIERKKKTENPIVITHPAR